MGRKQLFKNLSFFIISLFVLNLLALKFYWYFSIWYFDMPMHFLGGFCAGLLLMWFFSLKKEILEIDLPAPDYLGGRAGFNLILKIIFGVLFIGISWEIFEILFNNIIAQISFNILDTTSDIFFDLAGGVFAIFYYFIRCLDIKENNVQ